MTGSGWASRRPLRPGVPVQGTRGSPARSPRRDSRGQAPCHTRAGPAAVVRQNHGRRTSVDLALILSQSQLDDHPPAPSFLTAPNPLRQPPPPYPREPRLAPPALRLHANDDSAQAPYDGPTFLGRADQGLGRLEAVPRVRDSRDGPALAAAPFS